MLHLMQKIRLSDPVCLRIVVNERKCQTTRLTLPDGNISGAIRHDIRESS